MKRLLHYPIAMTMSATHYVVACRWPLLVRRPSLSGVAAYGLVLYGIMHYIVVPFSAASPGSTDPLWITLPVAVHMFLIGIPIALATERAHRVSVP